MNHTEASLTFPSFPRFCGRHSSNARTRTWRHSCQAYNDWMIDEWCAGDGHGRLIPCTIIPLWDADLAAKEVRRVPPKGPIRSGLHREPGTPRPPQHLRQLLGPVPDRCEETETVINMHIGSSSAMAKTAPDAPLEAGMALTAENSVHAFVDWLSSGALARFPCIKIALRRGSGRVDALHDGTARQRVEPQQLLRRQAQRSAA